jgi:hypothetical protein
MVYNLYALCEQFPQLGILKSQLGTQTKFCDLVLTSFKIGLSIAKIILENRLNAIDKEKYEFFCHKCGTRLNSKGLVPRNINCLIGNLTWKRKMACILAVFIPYKITAKLLTKLTGADVCENTIWNWVQDKGKEAMEKIENEVNMLGSWKEPEPEKIDSKISCLPLIIGVDGVFVPFRKNEKTPSGKTVWREVRIGILLDAPLSSSFFFWKITPRRKIPHSQISVIEKFSMGKIQGEFWDKGKGLCTGFVRCFTTKMSIFTIL